MHQHIFHPLWWTKCEDSCSLEVKVKYFLVAGCTAMETKHVILPEIKEENHIKIKNTCYTCIYLIGILYYFFELNLTFFKLLTS
jgi:hypothetical protein